MCSCTFLRARLINQRDLSLGLFEIANCFLEGSGTKKSPDVALNYLKLAANMGDLASQEREFLFLHGGTRLMSRTRFLAVQGQ
jgi:TPR repeat protein